MMKKNIIILTLAFIVISLSSCQKDNYTIAPDEDNGLMIFSDAIISPIVQKDTTGYAIFENKDNKYFLGELHGSGDIKIKKDISSLFSGQYRVDSLFILDFYGVNNNLVLFQVLKSDYSKWKMYILDTEGNTILDFYDTCQVADTLYPYYMGTIASPDNIRVYYQIGSYQFTGIAAVEYDYTGNMTDIKIDSSIRDLNFYGFGLPQRHNYSLTGLYSYDNSIGVFKFPYDSDTMTMKIIGDKYYDETFSTDINEDEGVITLEDYDLEVFFHVIFDYKNMKVLQTIKSPLLNRFIPTSVFKSGDSYIMFGFNWENEGYLFTYPLLKNVRGTWNTAIINNGNVEWTSNSESEKRLSLITGAIQTSDSTFTTFGYGKTFNYFPSTIIIKFNSNSYKTE